MLNSTGEDCPEHIPTENHPNEGNRNIDWPFKFSILLSGGKAQRERNGSSKNNQLPTPEVDVAEHIAVHSGFTQALQ
jgi:hypothetical protein